MNAIEELNQKFKIPGSAEIIAGRGGLPAVRITGKHSGEVYLHGAHVTEWKPAGATEVLWLSGKSLWQDSKAIRGGVPICFPWFGAKKDDPQAPAHGFARIRPWQLESITPSVDAITVTLTLQSDDATRKLWPHDFLLKHRITFGSAFVMSLELTNTGQSPFTAEQALHTYFAVKDARHATVSGLENTNYIDKVDAMKIKTQDGPITITAETDRVYLDTLTPCTLTDPGTPRKILVAKQGSKNTVVWNPWIAKAKAMPDFGDDEWPGMLCVETCNVGDAAIHLRPGETHLMTAHLSTAPLA